MSLRSSILVVFQSLGDIWWGQLSLYALGQVQILRSALPASSTALLGLICTMNACHTSPFLYCTIPVYDVLYLTKIVYLIFTIRKRRHKIASKQVAVFKLQGSGHYSCYLINKCCFIVVLVNKILSDVRYQSQNGFVRQYKQVLIFNKSRRRLRIQV